jgi:hypothetical protein
MKFGIGWGGGGVNIKVADWIYFLFMLIIYRVFYLARLRTVNRMTLFGHSTWQWSPLCDAQVRVRKITMKKKSWRRILCLNTTPLRNMEEWKYSSTH